MRIYKLGRVFSKTLLFFGLLGAGLATGAAIIHAGNSQSLTGWLWGGMDATGGGNTALGWISTNSRDCDTNDDGKVDAKDAAPAGCPTGPIVDYGVNIPVTDGAVTGQAWSEYYGWVSFDANDVVGAGNCGVGFSGAQRVGDKIVGGARILSIKDDLATGNSGGWRGCIALSNVSSAADLPGYGVTVMKDPVSGEADLRNYAWSDELGWIDFSRAKITATKTLKICQDSCASQIRLDTTGIPLGFTIDKFNSPTSRVLVACLGASTNSCGGDDTAVSASWTQISTPPYSDAVDVSQTGPLNVTIGARSSAKDGDKEKITATSGSDSAGAIANVTCSDNGQAHCDDNPSLSQTTCTGKTYSVSYTNRCTGATTTYSGCQGKRYCDFNYKEVAP